LKIGLLLFVEPLEEKQGHVFTRRDARELKPLLKKELERALQKGNTNLVIKISHLLIDLNGYISSSSDSAIDFVKPVTS
jgi:hypothetical protein